MHTALLHAALLHTALGFLLHVHSTRYTPPYYYYTPPHYTPALQAEPLHVLRSNDILWLLRLIEAQVLLHVLLDCT